MKILKILGAVLAVHLLAFVFIFTSPGCQSGPRNVPTPDSTVVAGPGGGPAGIPDTPVNYAPSNPNTYGRTSPTRPGSPNAVAITPARPAATNVTPVSTYTVERGDSLWSIAKKNRLTVAELARANSLGVNATLRPGQKLIVPAAAGAPADLSTAPSGPTYTVLPGETMSTIARKHGITTSELLAANNRTADLVRTGEKLVLPSNAKPPTQATEAAVVVPGTGTTHTVQAGESLGVIARRYGVRVADLAAANNITDPSRVRAGQQLVIPGGRAAAKQPSAPATTPSGPTPSTTPPQAEPTTPSTPSFDLTPPPPGQDLDAGLKDAEAEVPTVKVEEPPKE